MTAPAAAASDPDAQAVDLPYGPRMSALLEPIDRGFKLANRWFAGPVLRAGLGSWFVTPPGGSLMLLRTTGRRTGLRREVPLGYVIHDGAIWCCAGFGTRTAWYRNLLDDPAVEVVLPGAVVRGVADPVTERETWLPAFRALRTALGIVGRLTLGDLANASDDVLFERGRAIPLVRIRVTSIEPGPFDPGGRAWIVPQAIVLLGSLALLRAARGRVRGVRSGRA
jgi:deazaflavin-dependent oxidoreductase (nitroreductase family)